MKNDAITILGTPLKSVAIKFSIIEKITIDFNKPVLSDKKILAYLYNGQPYENVKIILHILKIINLETDDTISVRQIFDNFKSQYITYIENEIKNQITNNDVMDFFVSRSIYTILNILVNDSVHIVDEKIQFHIEGKALNTFENFTIDEYIYEKYKLKYGYYLTEQKEEDIVEIKEKYIEESLQIYVDILNQDSIQNYLKHKYAKQDKYLTQIEKQNAILNTLKHLKSTIENIENERYFIIQNLENKIKKKGNNQQLKVFEKLLMNAKMNYIIKDEVGEYFYPYLADVIYHAHELEKRYFTFFKLTRTKSKKEYYINKKEDSDLFEMAIFYEDVKLNNIWQFILEFSSLEYDANYESVKQLIKFIKFEKQNNQSHAFKNRLRALPYSIVETNKFTKHVSILEELKDEL